MIVIPQCFHCKHRIKNGQGLRCKLLYPDRVPGKVALSQTKCPSYEKDDETEKEGDIM